MSDISSDPVDGGEAVAATNANNPGQKPEFQVNDVPPILLVSDETLASLTDDERAAVEAYPRDISSVTGSEAQSFLADLGTDDEFVRRDRNAARIAAIQREAVASLRERLLALPVQPLGIEREPYVSRDAMLEVLEGKTDE